MERTRLGLVCYLLITCCLLSAQPPTHKPAGTQIITSGGKAADSLFISLLGGPDAKVIYIPTAASSLRSDSLTIWNPDETENKERYKQDLLKRFHLNNITILH